VIAALSPLLLYHIGWNLHEGVTQTMALICAVLLMATVLVVVIQSRAGWIGAGVVTVLLLPQVLRLPNPRRYLLLLALIAGVCVALYSLWFGGAERSLESLVGRQVRSIYWAHGLEMISKHPWLGIGYGHFEAAFVNDYYAVPQPLSGVPIIEQNLDHPHNEILYWGVEGGGIALSGLAVWLFAGIRLLRQLPWPQRLALIALPFPMLFHSMVEYPFYHSVAHWLALIWLVWFIDQEVGQPREYGCRTSFLFKSLALLVPLVTVPFMATGIQTAYLVTQFERGGMKDLTLLERVINPLPWFSRFMYDVMSIRLINALPSHNAAELQAYVAWATEFNAVQPRSQLYWNGALALDALQQPEEAARWRAEGVRLFPTDPLFKPQVASTAVSAANSAATATTSGGAAQP